MAIISVKSLPAQNNDYIFKHITRSNGLVNDQVITAIQDSKGFMWIGTQAGLQRYDGKRFTTYLADVHNPDALQSDWINALFEDSHQRLWVGTSVSGACLLNRVTGKFYNFNSHLTNGNYKTSGIWNFTEDKQGNIWVTAYDGFYKFNENSMQLEPMNSLLKMGAARASSVSVDGAGNRWFSTTTGIKKLAPNQSIVQEKDNNPDKLALLNITGAVANITFDNKGYTWVSAGYDHTLYRYTIADNTIKTYWFNKQQGTQLPGMPLQKEYIGNVFLCSNGLLLLPVLSRGLAVYDYAKDSFSLIEVKNYSPQGLHLGLNSFRGVGLLEDKEKSIWMSGDAGINIFNLVKSPFITYGMPQSGMGIEPPSEVSNIIQAPDGDIFVSHYFVNGGISRFDKNLNFKEDYRWNGKTNLNADFNQLWTLFRDKDGMLWAPNQGGSILKVNPVNREVTLLEDSILRGSINQLQQDASGNIWIAHNSKGLIKIDAVTKQATRFKNFYKPEAPEQTRATCMLFDGNHIWLGTLLNGLQLFDKSTGTFIASWQMNENNRQSISNNNITGIIPYSNDTLIISTQGGINIFDKNKQTFSSILSKDGLPNNLAQTIILDDRKFLWAGFAGGLSKIDVLTKRITNYDENDGILDNRFNPFFVRLSDGRLAIGASKSFLVFDPAKLREANMPPDVIITGFKVFEKPVIIDSFVNTATPYELSYKDNSFHIEFASLQFNAAGAISYFYQLQGVDKEWIAADPDQSVHYNHLSPGHYVFSVKCANRDGVFCKNITTISIDIIAPFWETWWFILTVLATLGIALYAAIKWREQNIKALEKGKTRLQQLTAEKYKAQFESEQISSFFTTSLLNKTDVDDVLWDVAKNLIGKLGFVDCMIYLWNDDKTKMIQKAGYGPKGSLEELMKQHFDVMPGQGVVGAVIQSGEAILVPDTTIDQRYRVDDQKRLSELCVPIKYNEQLLGVIDSEHHEKFFFTRQHLQVLTTIATLAASKIKSIEAEQHLRQQKSQLADVNDQLAEVQLAALRGQMNPHFIFNALNSIKKFVIANEPANAEKYLGKFSKLIRSILDNSRSGMVTVEKEIQLLKLYLDLEQLRFGSKLTYSISVDENIHLSDTEIPSMIVQPFAENAMLHGIMHREDDGRVDIRFINHEDWLEIVIEDNGIGRAKSAEYKTTNSEIHHSIGIEVATKRLQALRKNESTPAGIEIIDLLNDNGEGAGTKVIVSIPVV